MQGRFIAWEDDTPLTETNWLPKTYVSEAFNLDHLTSQHVVNSIEETIAGKEPSHNCTASTKIGFTLHWIIIPCDEAINASFVCQSEIEIQYRPFSLAVNPYNATCHAGSVLLSNSQKCYLLLEAEKQISFANVMKTCNAKNGNTLNVDVTDYVGSAADNQKLMWAFLYSYEKTYGKSPNTMHQARNIRYTDVKRQVFGNYLGRNSMANKLANILKWTLSHALHINLPLQEIKIFVAVNSHCGLLTYNGYARLYQDKLPDGFVKGWGVRYISCQDVYDIDAIVCEKASIPFLTSSCGYGFYGCEGTCILSTYRCDLIYDCFDKSFIHL